jgi:type-F conjugative transfer system pilin assembly protein TrbC
VRRFFLLPAWLLSLAAWGAPPGLPDVDAIQQEMARQKARSQELLRRAEDTFRADPERPVQSAPRVEIPTTGADPLAIAERYRKTRDALRDGNTGPDLLVFVSFSMPEASLKRLATDAARANAVLVFRGPKDGSLKQTLQAFEPLAKLGASAILHPEAFTWNRIDSVPVFVLGTAAGGGCDDAADSCRETIRIAGDASLEYILERMARAAHPLAEEAERRLTRLRGTP